jgi:TonB family protein
MMGCILRLHATGAIFPRALVVVHELSGQTDRMFLIAALLLQAVAPAAVPPKRLPSALLSSNDYPPAAVLLGQEGLVQVELTVSPDGKPTDCHVVGSSGFQALDSVTCSKVEKRARFTPALDTAGRTTVGSSIMSVEWVIAGNELPVAPWSIRLMVGITRSGHLTNCAIQSGGALKQRPQMVIDCRDLSGAFTVPQELAARYAGRETVLIFDQQFVPRIVNSINTPIDLTRFPLIRRNVLRLTIDDWGRVQTCSLAESNGNLNPSTDACSDMRTRRFAPDSKRTTPLTGTATTAIYAYVK